MQADNTSTEKLELFRLLLEKKGIRHTRSNIIPRAEKADYYPLSFAQQRLWFLDQFEPGSSLYNISNSVRISGPLNLKALGHTFDEIISHHDILRTTFETRDGQPVQLIAPHARRPPVVIDLSALPREEREREAKRLSRREAALPFDLSAGPLLRVAILRLDREDHVILLTMHHIISDGWSMGILTRELTALYQASAAGRPASLPNLPIQYVDYAVWQRERLSGEVLESHLNYWKQQLAGVRLLELPTDRARPATQSHRGANVNVRIGTELTSALMALAKGEEATLFMALMAAWQVLLMRYTGQDDIAVGTPIAGRTQDETEGLIGFFINMLVLRTNLSGAPSFRQLLGRVREVALGAYAHQDAPFEKLVDELQPERTLSHTPLFQAVMVLQNTPEERTEMDSLRMSGLGSKGSALAKFDLTLTLAEGESGLSGTLEYKTDLFDAATMTRIARHFERLLAAIVANPDQRLDRLPLLNDAERRQLLVEWNDPAKVFDGEASLPELFERQARLNPESIALSDEAERLSYRELNERANQLAHRLRELGVGPEVPVALCLERGIEMVVGILGVLKAGGAYLPLDPLYPRERLALILADAAAPVLLTQQHLLASLPPSGARVLSIDADWPDIALRSSEDPVSVATPEQTAYIIYTSGSTGKPKGTLVTHANVTRLFKAADPLFRFNADDVWTLFHSYAFDFSVWELWGALLYGGRLVVVPYWVSRTPERFYSLLCRERVTVLNQTPSAFRQLMSAEEASGHEPEALSLRVVVFGGEALEIQSLRSWFARHGDDAPIMVNMYGITETTVHVTWRVLRSTDAGKGRVGSAIGVPLDDLQVYVLDRQQELLPVGVWGELYVGGGGVARGYLNRPELTAERFIPNPFNGRMGARLYRTGDVGRYLANGELEYLGRADAQVKIRGHRIELGEIEVALHAHSGVREVVVLAKEDASGDKRLMAYVVAARDEDVKPGADEWRGFLKERLPEYMLPAVFVALDEMPLTENGKVDRRALLALEIKRVEAGRSVARPRTEEEEVLTNIWAEVLGVEEVGIDDNFFALGGDSIRSVLIVAKAREHGIEFSLQHLFQHQTIRELSSAHDLQTADVVETTTGEAFDLISVEDREKIPEGVEDAYPLTMLQAGMLFEGAYNERDAIYHNVSTYHLEAPFDLPAMKEAMHRVLRRHPVLRTSFDLLNFSEPLQLVHRSIELPLHVEDLRDLPEATQEERLAEWFEEEKRRPFDWAAAPLLRFHLHRRSRQRFQFNMTEHHAILDGWSVATMLTELFQTYLQLLKGQDDAPEPSPVNIFKDYVAREQEALKSAENRRFWTEKLDGSTVTTLPRRPASDQQSGPRIIVFEVPVPMEVSVRLKELAREAAVPTKSVLLAAHLRVLSVLSGQTDVLTGMLTHGRPEQAEGVRGLGLYLNNTPFRQHLTGGNWLALVRETFESERRAMPFRYYPMAQMQRDNGGQSLFDVAFNFTHFHVYESLQELSGVQVLGGTTFAETDLVLWAGFSLDLATTRIKLSLQGDGRKIRAEQLKEIGAYYARALEAMARDPHAHYERQSLMPEDEQRRVLVEWNDTATEYPRETCLHELFEAQAARTPAAEALVCDNRRLTYRELNERANQLAHRLRKMGIGPEVPVGVMMERSAEMVIALLGILKAGGAYVPLDTQYPKERLAFMVEDSGLSVMLTQEHLQPELPESSAQVLALDSDWQVFSGEPTDNPGSFAVAGNLAYLIYTSGSTGVPKGVAIEHRSATAFIHWAHDIYAPSELAGVLGSTSICFDLSVFEIFAPLTRGGKLILAENALQLPSLKAAHEVTLVNTVPTAMTELLRIGGVPPSVRTVNLAGEPLKLSLAQQTYQQGTVERLFNLYGPSEDTTYSTWSLLERHISASPSIGRPIANTQVYLLDGALEPVPTGVAGDLYLSGDGLARGYLRRPELTAERFIPSPFAHGEPGTRLYRTGDVGRYLPDGQIEYLGRSDQQVKVRGFRIELGEVEAELGRCAGVRESVVVVREDAQGSARLVAYVVPDEGVTLAVSELRQSLGRRLPEYMVPSLFVMLEALPLTPNGKVDRRALPAPDATDATRPDHYVAPQTPAEEIVADIFAQVLGVERVGITDNFFELGGHSLLATRVMARVTKVFQVGVGLRRLFEGPTVGGLVEALSEEWGGREVVEEIARTFVEAGLLLDSIGSTASIAHAAAPLAPHDKVNEPAQSAPGEMPSMRSTAADALRRQDGAQSWSPLVRIQKGAAQPPLFCVHPVDGNVLCYLELAGCLDPAQPIYGLQAKGLDATQEAHTRIEDMAAEYVKAVREVQPTGPYFLCGWSMGGVIAFEMSHRLQAEGQRVSFLGLIDSVSPLLLTTPAVEEDELGVIEVFARSLGLTADHLSLPREKLSEMSSEELLTYLGVQAKSANLIPEDLTREQFNRLYQVFRTNAIAIKQYVPRARVRRITLLSSEESASMIEDSTFGWGDLSIEAVEVFSIPGTHFSIVKKPAVEILARQLKECLDKTAETVKADL
jgi:amino acid adenylation domain-containing protein